MLFKFCVMLLLLIIVPMSCCTVLHAVNFIQNQSGFTKEINSKLCNFFDTINITDGFRNSGDDSITFNDTRFAKENYGTYAYTYLANHMKITVPPHIRGCICKYKNCVRVCCPTGHLLNPIISDDYLWQYACVPNDKVTQIDLDHLLNIVFVNEMPCKHGYLLDPDESWEQWKVLPNGSLRIGNYRESLIVERDGYCLAQYSISDTDNDIFITNVMLCTYAPDEHKPPTIDQLIFSSVMVVSVIFLLLTLSVYIWIEELRTVHGKSFMCYLAMLIIGYSVLAFNHIADWHVQKGATSCLILAEVTHTAFIGGFIWLSIIGYDIWRVVGRADQRSNQFLKYFIFTCVTTFLIVLITNLLDHVNLLDDDFRPGLGTSECWLQDTIYANFLYLYSIIIIIITINTVFYVLAKRKLVRAQEISSYARNTEDSRKFGGAETDVDRFQLFFRLAFIMGLPWFIEWFIEIISWLTDANNIIIYIIHKVTMLIGPFIFVLCVQRPRVKRLIKQKCTII